MDAAASQGQDDAVLYTAAAAFLVTAAQFLMDPQQTSRKRKKRWDASSGSAEERNEYFAPLIPRLRQEDWETHFVYFRMTPPQFDMLLTFIGPRICKYADNDQRGLSPSHKLALTLRYLACGTSMSELESEYMVSRSVICAVVPEVCGALWASMQPTYMPVPRMTDWKRISADMHNRLDVPNCVGSLDGKHVNVVRPQQNAGFKRKKGFDIVLLAVCDARRCFTIVDVSCNGGSGAGVFNNSEFGWRLREDALNLPEPSSIPGISQPFPHYFVADEAFPLSNNLLRPYPSRDLTTNSRIFNYRISRPRSIIENTFGIIGTRWRILHMPIDALPATVEKIIKTICILHNFLVRNEAEIPPTDRSYCPPSLVDVERPDGTIVPGRWRQYNAAQNCLQPVHRLANNNYARSASQNRDKLRDYFVSDAGALSWQERYLSRGSDDL